MHGHSVLDLALEPMEANFALPLVHEIADANERSMLDVAVAAEVNLVGDPILVAADAARAAGNSPNSVMAAAAAIVGPNRVERALACTRKLIDLFAHSGLKDGDDESFDSAGIMIDDETRALFMATEAEANDPRPEAMLAAVQARGGKSAFLKFLASLGGRPSRDAILGAISLTIAWGPLMRKRISRLAETDDALDGALHARPAARRPRVGRSPPPFRGSAVQSLATRLRRHLPARPAPVARRPQQGGR